MFSLLTLVVLLFSCGQPTKKQIQNNDDNISGSYIVAWIWNSTSQKNSGISFLETLPNSMLTQLRGAEYLGALDSEKLNIMRLDFVSEEEGKHLLNPKTRSKNILFAEPNRINRMFSMNRVSGKIDQSLTEAYATKQDEFMFWWQKQIKLPQALSLLTNLAEAGHALNLSDASAPVIAVLDSGIDVLHPALKDHIWVNPHVGEFGCVDDKNGCNTTQSKEGSLGTGSVHPYATSGFGEPCPIEPQTDEPNSFCLHGTHVAGLIAGDVYAGMGGVCPVCKILPIKVVDTFNGQGSVSDSSIIAALFYLLRIKEKLPGTVRVANTSFGKFQKSKALELLLRLLYSGKDGLLMVAASGNEDTQKRVFPAAYDQVLSVGAISYLGHKAPYSNFGTWVDVVAPGGSQENGQNLALLSAVPGGGYNYNQGTSMAAPIAAGVLGLALALNPDLTPHELKALPKRSADASIYDRTFAFGVNYTFYYPELKNPGSNTKRIALMGQGLLDASQALNLAQKTDSQALPFQLPQERKVISCN